MTAASFPTNSAVTTDAWQAFSPVAAVITTMRRLSAAGAPISADQAREWSDTLLQELYTQPPVRWEYRHQGDSRPGYWMSATPEHFYHARVRRWVVRALWETPRVIQPKRDHAFNASVCTGAEIPRTGPAPTALRWSGPWTRALAPQSPPPSPRWLVEPLKWLRDAGPHPVGRYDRERRARDAAFLLGKIGAHILECQNP